MPNNSAKLAYSFLVSELVSGTELNLIDSEKSAGSMFERVGGAISTLKLVFLIFSTLCYYICLLLLL